MRAEGLSYDSKALVTMRQSFIGKVTSNKMMKSVVVTVTYLRKIPKYHVWRRFQSKIMAHDALDECQIGDTVKIESCRPLSKRKAFRVTELLVRANQYDASAKAAAKERSAAEVMKAEERWAALTNELVSRRQFLEKEAMEAAQRELDELAPTLERIELQKKVIQAHWDKQLQTTPSYPSVEIKPPSSDLPPSFTKDDTPVEAETPSPQSDPQPDVQPPITSIGDDKE